MVDSASRVLRDGVLEGEFAPALMIKDCLSLQLGFHVFDHFLCTLCSNVVSGRSQARGLVVITFARKPVFYFDLLKRRGIDTATTEKWFQILDCYSDPLGWKGRLLNSQQECGFSQHPNVSTLTDVTNTTKLISSVLDLGKGIVGQGKGRFSVAIDLVSEPIRHTSLQLISNLINNLRSHDQVSSLLWLMHSDLHEPRTVAALEYLSSMVASLGPMAHVSTVAPGGSINLRSSAHNFARGKLHLRLKRRNGRVRIMYEELFVERGGVKFVPVSSESVVDSESSLPKVQFNLQLTEKEKIDRANVVLPFEHQGNGKPIEIYDGRRLISNSEKHDSSGSHSNDLAPAIGKLALQTDNDGRGEIHYVRDSDEETFDSDEDPDDDLDI